MVVHTQLFHFTHKKTLSRVHFAALVRFARFVFWVAKRSHSAALDRGLPQKEKPQKWVWWCCCVWFSAMVASSSSSVSLACAAGVSGSVWRSGGGWSFLVSRVRSAPVVGFSGSRAPSRVSLAAVGSAASWVRPGSAVLVGCARGVDARVRSRFPGARVFSVSSGRFGSGRAAFARRSAACVRAVAAAGGVWLSFPAGACPVRLVPGSVWRSASGSGSWGSLALAVGLGVPCVVFLPGSVSPPSGWGFVSVAGCPGWWWFPGA